MARSPHDAARWRSRRRGDPDVHLGFVVSVLLVAGVLVAGCSAIPDDGRVVQVGQVAQDDEDDLAPPRDVPVRRVPAGPPRGATPAAIVQGFIDAQASFDGDHAVARSFLVPDARWDDGGEAVVYDRRRISGVTRSGNRAELTVTARRRGIVNITTGEYRPTAPDDVAVPFRLAVVNGEWRVADPPAGMLVSEGNLTHAFRRVTLYFPDFTRQHLVPQPIFLRQAVESPFLATVLRALLAGPAPSLQPAVRTAIPQGTELIDAPALEDEQVTVNLSREVRRASTETVPLLAAQIVWTLTEPALGYTGVRLLVEGSQLTTGKDRRVLGRSDFQTYSPELSPGDDRGFFLRSGRLQAIDDAGEVQTVRSATGLGQVSVSRNGVQLAALSRVAGGRQQLLVGRLVGDSLRAVLTARLLTEPSWQPDSSAVWVVARDSGAPRVYVVPAEGGRAETVRTPGLAALGPIHAFQLSPDGARAVLVAGQGAARSLWQAYVEPQADGTHLALGGLRRLFADVGDVSAVCWETATRLGFVGAVSGRRGLYRIDYDGYALARTDTDGLPRLPDGLAGGRGASGLALLAGVSGQVWRQERSGDWVRIATGTDPTYAG